MSHPPYHICPQRNVPRLPDLNSPCITFRLASLTHLACVTLPSSPRPTRTLLACHALTIHCPSVQNSPYRCTHSMPAKPCHFTSSPAITDPSMPARPLHVQSLPDPNAPRQPASAIPCLLSLPSCSSPRHYLSFASSPASTGLSNPVQSPPSSPCLLLLA